MILIMSTLASCEKNDVSPIKLPVPKEVKADTPTNQGTPLYSPK